jgi:hypothetical protein
MEQTPMKATIPMPTRRSLQPVNVTGRFVGGATRADVLNGAAVLSITDNTTGEEQAYWTQAVYDGPFFRVFRLRKLGSGDVYDLARSLDRCNCADATYRPHRPDGCRHQVALQQAFRNSFCGK